MISFITGDATSLLGDKPKILAHIVNDRGGWGKGFVLAISKKWKEPEAEFRQYSPLQLDTVQFVPVEWDAEGNELVTIANMCAQTGYGKGNRNLHRTSEPNETPPIRYEALRKCLELVAAEAKECGASVHMPKIGTGLAGGDWKKIFPIIQETLADVRVFVYDLPV